MNILTSVHSHGHCCCQIVVLNKTKERMQPYQSNQEEEDPDIKKIKKVHFGFYALIMQKRTGEQRETPSVP